MGYTHYWYRKPRLDKSKWNDFTEDVTKLLNNADCPLSHFYKGENRNGYKATSVMVNFNGYDENSHENVYIPRIFKKEDWQKPNEDGLFFGCCKTARKPYDKYVTACLLLFKHHFGDEVAIASDGNSGEWEEGRLLLQKGWLGGGEMTKATVQEWLGETEEDETAEDTEEAVEVKAADPVAKEVVLPPPSDELIENFEKEYFSD